MNTSTAALRWQVIRSMHGSVIESHELVDESGMQRSFAGLMLEWTHAGWKIGDFSQISETFFCDRDGERRMVSIDSSDPYEPSPHDLARLGGCTNCED